MINDFLNNPIDNCPNLTKVYFTSTTAGYVEGETWFDKPLKYMKWNGTDHITIDADVSNFTTTDETVTVDKITNTYERYTDTDPNGNTFSQDTGNYVFKYDNLTGLWICMNYYGGPQIKNDSTSYKQFCWLGTYGSGYTQYYNIVQCDSNTHEILNDIIPNTVGEFYFLYYSYNFVAAKRPGGYPAQ